MKVLYVDRINYENNIITCESQNETKVQINFNNFLVPNIRYINEGDVLTEVTNTGYYKIDYYLTKLRRKKIIKLKNKLYKQ